MRIKRATHKSFGCTDHGLGYGQNREAPLHDKFGLHMSPDAFLKLEGAARDRKPSTKVTLPSVSILARRA